MGRPIVYCGSCGKSLREEEFTKGRAHLVDNTPFCTACRPLPAAAKTPAEDPPAPAASVRSLSPSAARRRVTSILEDSSSKTVAATLAVLAVVVLLVLGVAAGSGPSVPVASRPPDPPVPFHLAPAPAPEPARPPALAPATAEERALVAIRTLETLSASSADPDAVLESCRQTRAALAGTPYLARVDAVEARAQEAWILRSRERQVTMTLEGVQKIREVDPRFERREEVESLLRAALPLAGTRRAEVEQVLADYREAAGTRPAPVPAPLPPAIPPSAGPATPGRLGPYDLEDGALRQWLILGPFPARKDRQALTDHDLLKTEADHVPAAGLDVATREGKTVTWTAASTVDGKVLFRALDPVGPATKPQEPALAFAACWLNVEKDCAVKFRGVVDSSFMMWLDHKRIWNYAKGQGLGAKEEVMQATLTAGPHLILMKVLSLGGEFGFRLRVTAPNGERIAGIHAWDQVPVLQKILFSENFNQGRSPFIQGETVAGGVNGSPALSVPKSGGVWIDGKLPLRPVGPTWTVRFKAKPLRDLTQVEVLVWTGKPGISYWYHVRGLKKDEWNAIEIKAAQLNRDWRGKGPTFEGDVAQVLKFYYDDAVPDGSLLIDDVEVSE
jgi:hypothetical protein